MADFDASQTINTELTDGVDDYDIGIENLDDPSGTKETKWINPDFPENLAYYKKKALVKQPIDAIAMWTVGKGWEAKEFIKVMLDRITGWGEDCFQSIMWNMIVMKKVNGDSFAEIIRNKGGTLINIKTLNCGKITIITNQDGIIIRYEQTRNDGKVTKFKPNQIFHLCNNRIGDEIHGTDVIESCKWAIDARSEAMADWRRLSHRSTIRIMYVEMDDATRMATIRSQYKDAINKGEVMILPGKPDEANLQDFSLPPLQPFIEWIRYLEDFILKSVGTPQVILGGSSDYSEAGSKMGFLTFEQPYMTEQRLLETDIFNQLGLRVEFNRPVSLKDDVQSSEEKNTGQVGIQPTETEATVSRNE